MSKSNNKDKDNNKDKNNNLNECVNSSIFSGANTNKMEEQKKVIMNVILI